MRPKPTHAFDLEAARGHDRGSSSRPSSGTRRWIRRNSFWIILIITLGFMILLLRRFAHHSRHKVNDSPDALTQATTDDSTSGMCEERILDAGWVKGERHQNQKTINIVSLVHHPCSESPSSQARSLVYSKMGLSPSKGLSLGGIITQGLKQSDLFSFSISQDSKRELKGSKTRSIATASVIISPILKSLEIPVRAIVAPLLDKQTCRRIKEAVHSALLPSDKGSPPVLPPGSLWLQDDQMYHASLYHASSHMSPIKASSLQVEEEAGAVIRLASKTCPIQAILEKVILTSGGVIVACWQVLPDGSEPSEIRKELSKALPNSPPESGQAVKEPTMLHVTIARLLLPPEELGVSIEDEAAIRAVASLSEMLCGLKAEFDTLWFIEEQDLLALALRGRFVKHEAKMTCPT